MPPTKSVKAAATKSSKASTTTSVPEQQKPAATAAPGATNRKKGVGGLLDRVNELPAGVPELVIVLLLLVPLSGLAPGILGTLGSCIAAALGAGFGFLRRQEAAGRAVCLAVDDDGVPVDWVSRYREAEAKIQAAKAEAEEHEKARLRADAERKAARAELRVAQSELATLGDAERRLMFITRNDGVEKMRRERKEHIMNARVAQKEAEEVRMELEQVHSVRFNRSAAVRNLISFRPSCSSFRPERSLDATSDMRDEGHAGRNRISDVGVWS